MRSNALKKQDFYQNQVSPVPMAAARAAAPAAKVSQTRYRAIAQASEAACVLSGNDIDFEAFLTAYGLGTSFA